MALKLNLFMLAELKLIQVKPEKWNKIISFSTFSRHPC